MAFAADSSTIIPTVIARIDAVVIACRPIAQEDCHVHGPQRPGQFGDDLMRVVGLAEEAAVDQRPEVFVVQDAGDLPRGDAHCGGDEADYYHRRPYAVEDVSQHGGHAEAYGDHVQQNRPTRNQHVTSATTDDQSDRNHLMPDDGVDE